MMILGRMVMLMKVGRAPTFRDLKVRHFPWNFPTHASAAASSSLDKQ